MRSTCLVSYLRDNFLMFQLITINDKCLIETERHIVYQQMNESVKKKM